MSNLIPEQRFDKNGRLVTRHVRSTAPLLFGKSGIPSPKAHHYHATTAVEEYMETLAERGAESGNIPAIADALAAVNEETRILVMTALHDHTDTNSTLMLSYALTTKDEQFIRSVSLSLGYCSNYVRTVASRENVDPKQYKSILGGLHHSHNGIVQMSSKGMPLAEYDHARDEMIATAFKVEHIAQWTSMSRKVQLKFEYYKHLSLLADNMEEVEAATPAIVELVAARRHHAIAHKESTDALALDAHDLMSIAAIVSDYPHAENRIYDIVIDHGSFDPDRIRLALESGSPVLVQGVL
jgi:hypothetical protein